MTGTGYFADMLGGVERVVSVHFTPGAIISTKHVKKAMGIPNGDKSATVFVARALQELEARGVLEAAQRNGVRRYKVRAR